MAEDTRKICFASALRGVICLMLCIACGAYCLGCSMNNHSSENDDNGGVAFFGDSLTYMGDWGSYFPNANIHGLGVSGDTVLDLMDRIDEVKDCAPRKVFIMAGINDLLCGESVETVAARWSALLDALGGEYDVYILSVLPVKSFLIADASRIPALNSRLKLLAEDHHAAYIDIYSLMVDQNAFICDAYTVDGVHLSDAGYAIWAEAVRDMI